MDIGKLNNNTEFYDGFEDEHEIELYITDNPEINIHIWEGYFGDIFRHPSFDGNGWNGFTRDYQQLERTYEEKNVTIDIVEYLTDLYIYRDNTFEYDDTRKCYNLLCDFLEYAKENGKTVKVNWW